jgi:polyisoprenyl-teichoic acid--peptidoglycan teichoic acid transferase
VIRRPLLVLLALAQVLLLTAGGALAAQRWVAAPLDGDDDYVLAVLGSDAGPPRSGSALAGRADAIHLVVVPADRSAVSIVSIPRDSYVPVRGYGRTKINAGLTKGPEAMVGTLEDLTGLDIDDWMVTSFNGFKKGLDALGGVDIDVEQRLNDPKGAHSDLRPGQQVLDGTQALAYSRDRKSRSDGDFGRNRAQAKVLAALHAQLVAQVDGPADLLAAAAVLRQHTVSSIPPDRLVRLAALAATIPPDRVALEQADGYATMAGRASVVRLTDRAMATFRDVREDGILSQLVDE